MSAILRGVIFTFFSSTDKLRANSNLFWSKAYFKEIQKVSFQCLHSRKEWSRFLTSLKCWADWLAVFLLYYIYGHFVTGHLQLVIFWLFFFFKRMCKKHTCKSKHLFVISCSIWIHIFRHLSPYPFANSLINNVPRLAPRSAGVATMPFPFWLAI